MLAVSKTYAVNTLNNPEVTCVFSSSCLLPCHFQVGTLPLIHWIYMPAEDTYIHSYYFNQDQQGYRDQLFRGRTSLFKDQISRGNASLLLRGVKVQDEGRYKCRMSFCMFLFAAPVSEVSISQEGNRITCSSEGIYPEPELTWSTSPPSNMELQNRTRVQQTEEQLYSISSSLMVSDRDPDLSYSCTVRTQRNQKTAIYTYKPSKPSQSGIHEGLSLSCKCYKQNCEEVGKSSAAASLNSKCLQQASCMAAFCMTSF
uniref:Ig-like domain-containing protein n=1 Tax=Kryptolebias marmoratus TaxID=37003 RepID=A0A3Q3AQ74_KRYMA